MCTNIYQKLIIGPIKKILQSKAVEQQTLQSTYIQQRIPPFKTIPSMCIVAHIIIKSRQSLARWVIAFFIPQRINRIAIGKLKMHHSWLDSFIQNFQGDLCWLFDSQLEPVVIPSELSVTTSMAIWPPQEEHNYLWHSHFHFIVGVLPWIWKMSRFQPLTRGVEVWAAARARVWLGKNYNRVILIKDHSGNNLTIQ